MKQNFKFILVLLFLALTMSFVSANYRIASVDNGYLYISSDSGLNWTQKDTSQNWRGVSISESGQYMFATRTNGNPKRSIDYGNNWSEMTTGATNPRTICNSNNGEIVFITGTSNKIYKSTNYGANWNIAYNTTSNFFNIDCSENGQYITAVIEDGYIVKSNDYGVNWTTFSTSKYWKSICLSNDGKYQLAVTRDGSANSQFYKSIDYGANFSEFTISGVTKSRTCGISGDGNTWYINKTNEKIYKSTDYGANWSEITNILNSDTAYNGIKSSLDGRYINTIGFDATVGKNQISSDSGLNWTQTDVNRDWQGLAISSRYYSQSIPPTASVGTGTYYNNFSVTLNNNNEADIYYTTDGSDPDDTDTLYSGAISITGTTTLKAISWDSNEYKSEISSYTYTMVVADPSITVATGTYNNDFTTTITSATTTASIYYTTNGDTPDTGDTLYSGAISITDTTTLKAKAFQTGYTDSGTDSKTYTMVVAGTPTADKNSGLYYDPFNVTLTKTGTTTDTKLTYTLNGDAPTIASTEYSAPLTISESLTLKFAEFKEGYTETSIVTKTYEVREPITNFNFYDENTLLPIPTVTIADANGSTYTSDVNGLWTTSLSNIAKSFTISKTGYDNRPFEFYFKRQDANYNFLLNPTGLDSSIGFIVKDSNDNLWTNKYIMFSNDGNIIGSYKTSAIGTATASLLANGDYNALLYDATGTLVDTYEKTTVTVNKPKNEVTFAAISPYDITVGGLLGYSLTNQSASSVSFNIFAGTQGFYYFSVVDYNAVPADRKYIPRQYFTQVPMGTGYESALTYQPYLLLETDAVVPKITVLDQLNKPIGDVDIFISRSINNVQTIVESGKTTSTGNMSFSAYPLEYYYINVIYNGVDKGTFRVQPRESSDNFIIVIDTSDDVVDTGELIITADFSGTPKVVNIDDTNINADITITQSLNQATSYNLYLIQNNVTKASTSGAISGLVTSIDYDFDSSVVDRFNNNLTLKLVVNYPDGNQTFYYTITATKNAKGLMYFAPQIINDIGQPLGIILAILITGIILATLTFSGLNISPTAITILGVLILGVFMFLGWLDTGITVLGFDIARFFYVLMAIAMIYFMMRGEQYA